MFHVSLIAVLFVWNPDHVELFEDWFHSLKMMEVMDEQLEETMLYVVMNHVEIGWRDLVNDRQDLTMLKKRKMRKLEVV